MAVFVNRTLNMKKIQVVGFDMDYTLVRYNAEDFESLSHRLASAYLVHSMEYPKELLDLEFDFSRAIVGLVIDKRNGNLLQVSRYGKVKTSYHGMTEITYREQNKIYGERAIDVRDAEFESLDTSFAISNGVLFSQLVELKKSGIPLPDYRTLANDVVTAIDMCHRNGSIKAEILKNPERYIIKDPKVPELLERYLDYGKKLIIITNSDYLYTQRILDYALDPYWKNHTSWKDVFSLVITFANKPGFFERNANILKVDETTGMLKNYDGILGPGIYQGGWFKQVEDSLKVSGSEILYIGDHIYGDVISIKKECGWRTALVLGDLEKEIQGMHRSRGIQTQIDMLMNHKQDMEAEINEMDIQKYEGKKISRDKLDELYQEMDNINRKISDLIKKYNTYFNPHWGQILRAGNEESRYAEQVERYACVYMTKVSDLWDCSPKTYFRPMKRMLPHEWEQP
ncbi:MAG: HAD-IG family 5'-nucleotidase [Spirochaetales bacterium]|nr:HAD-IG family 5'-nucleotidase [Spirochaetales bacterium]